MSTFFERLLRDFAGAGANTDKDYDSLGQYYSQDPYEQQLAQTGFDVNRFIRNQMADQSERLNNFDSKTAYNEALFEGVYQEGMTADELESALGEYAEKEGLSKGWDPTKGEFDTWNAGESWTEYFDDKNRDTARTLGTAAIDNNKAQIKQQAEMEIRASELAPVIGAGAGLFKLGELEAAEGAITQKQNFQDPSLYRVNATNGAANFLAKDGGLVGRLNLSGVLNPAKMDKVNKYHYGGTVNNDPVGNYEAVGERINRYVGGGKPEELAPVQTESGGKGKEEMIILPTLDILPVNATMRHSKMDENEVTDLLPENSYITSQFGFKLNREEAANIVTEVGSKPYNIFGGNSVPLEQTLASMFDKKEQSPSDVVRNIKKKFTIVDSSDPFTLAANDENRLNSLPYLQGVIIMSEEEKKKMAKSSTKGDGKIEIEEGAGTYPELDPSQVFANGGRVMKRNNVPKAAFGLGAAMLLSGGLQGASGLFNLFNSGKEKKEIKRIQALNEKDIDNLAEKQSANNAIGTGVGMAALLAQDTKIEGQQLEVQRLLQRQSQIAPDIINGMSNQYFNSAPIQDAFSNTGNFQRGVAAGALNFGQAQANANQLQYNNATQGLERSNRFSAEIQNIINQQKGIDTNVANQNRAARNAQLSGLGGLGMGYFNTDSNIQGAQTNAQIANRGTAQSALSQVNAAQRQSVQNMANVGSQMAMTYGARKAQEQKSAGQTPQTPLPRSDFGNMPDFNSSINPQQNFNVSQFDIGSGVSGLYQKGNQGMSIQDMINQNSEFKIDRGVGFTFNGLTLPSGEKNYMFGNTTAADLQNFQETYQGPMPQEETLYSPASIASPFSTAPLQSNVNNLPTPNYTGCHTDGFYYQDGVYNGECI